MIETNRHIISTIKWESSFDKKDGSYRLQDRLSQWSKYSMLDQMDHIFNHISSPYITWQIDSLTIDLGTILLDELEQDLSLRFKKELNEKLSELLVSSKYSNKNIKIVNRKVSVNNLLEYYFQKGTMPWNFNHSYGSINEILEYQLAQNTRVVIYLFRHLAKDLNIRKRMAWQVNEGNQKRLIHHLEPYYHAFITDTLNEIIEIQNKLKLVPSHISIFKKYLNVWVFNYLFSRQSLVFGKEEFIASIINQMAQWYGLEINFLSQSIHQNAKVLKLENISTFGMIEINGSGILSKQLLQENGEINQIEYEVSWIKLKKYLLDSPTFKKASEIVEYNELVTRLYFHNPSRFAKLMSSLDTSAHFWTLALEGASYQTFEVFVTILAADKSKGILEIVNFLTCKVESNATRRNQKTVWKSALNILSNSNNRPADHREFLKQILSANSNFISLEKSLDYFENTQIPSAEKTISSIEIHSNIRDLSKQKTVQADSLSSFLTVDDSVLIQQLFDYLLEGSIGHPKFKAAQKQLARKVNLNPYSIFKALTEHGANQNISRLLPLIFDEFNAGRLLQICRPVLYKLLLTIQDHITEKLDHVKVDNASLLRSITNQLMVIGVRVILLANNLTNEQFIYRLFKEIRLQFPSSLNLDLQQIELELLDNKKLNELGISVELINKLRLSIEEEEEEEAKLSQGSAMTLISTDNIPSRAKDIYSLIAQNILLNPRSSLKNNTGLSFADLIYQGLTSSPQRVRQIIGATEISNLDIDLLLSTIGLDQFIALISSDLHSGLKQDLLTYKFLYQLIEKVGGETIISKSKPEFWRLTLESIKARKVNKNVLKQVVEKTLNLLSEKEGLNIEKITFEIKYLGLPIPKILKDILGAINVQYSNITEIEIAENLSEVLDKYHNAGRLEELLYQLIITNRIPSWFQQKSLRLPETLTKEIINFQPLVLLNVLKKHSIPDSRLSALCSMIPFSEMVVNIYQLHPLQQKQLIIIEEFHRIFGQIHIQRISQDELKHVLYKKVLAAWSSNQWSMLSSINIWKEIMWEVCVHNSVDKNDFLEVMESNKALFPSALKLGLNLLIATKNNEVKIPNEIKTKPIFMTDNTTELMTDNTTELMTEEIAINNAGIVLLNGYLPMLFERMSLVADQKFINEQAQLDAVHMIQFLVTGQSQTDEMYLPLNKLLCGLGINTPILDNVDITDDQKSIMEGLISAAIGHWPSIGESSIDGFRGNWLVRDGLLSEGEDRWELRVDKRPYDLLINQAPFSFSIIKFPWMKKPIHVTWPY